MLTFLQIPQAVRCRFFNKPASDGCKNPSKDAAGNTGRDGRRATEWLSSPGPNNFKYDFPWKSYVCASESQEVEEAIKAVCSNEKGIFCNSSGGAGWDD